jgi:hypothetical protein
MPLLRRETRELESALAEKQAEVEAAEAARDAALAEVEDARAARELHDGEIELLLRQWHGEKSSWSKAAKAVKEKADEEKVCARVCLYMCVCYVMCLLLFGKMSLIATSKCAPLSPLYRP